MSQLSRKEINTLAYKASTGKLSKSEKRNLMKAYPNSTIAQIVSWYRQDKARNEHFRDSESDELLY